MRSTSRAALIGMSALPLVLVPGVSHATPSSGVSSTTLYERTVDGTTYTLKRITISPGGTTGWHYHPGTVYGIVREGTLTHSDADCATDGVYSSGDTITEPAGPEHVHIGRNLGSSLVVLDALYVDLTGTPLTVDAPDPGCHFQ
ncbi:cupin domain-containing protein [Streptomyces sp. NPDC013978]|uniref:cupin domain-containing protein n=1 Tax=Streptomyces sp. NPDC013978 TaxID=3364869 RepID=UPI0036F68CC0